VPLEKPLICGRREMSAEIGQLAGPEKSRRPLARLDPHRPCGRALAAAGARRTCTTCTSPRNLRICGGPAVGVVVGAMPLSKTVLSPAASRAFVLAILNPASPNAALLKAARRYRFTIAGGPGRSQMEIDAPAPR
jgi:hypothetical protein